MTKIHLHNVSIAYPQPKRGTRTVLDQVSLDIPAGQFVCLLGPSGCGKTTLMNVMAGFETPHAGAVQIDGRPVIGPSPNHIVIFQDYGLFPWRTVLANVTYGLEARGERCSTAREKAMRYLELVGLTHAAHQHPHQLSGGMKQRVSIARALAVEPDILFMDEPFGALDAFTRFRLQDELLRIWQERRMTIIFVTHDIEEAVYLAQRVILLSPNPGRIKRILDINLPRPTDRTSDAFSLYRREVFRTFELIHEQAAEYAI